MRKKITPVKCVCCLKNDLDTKEIPSWLFPKSNKMFVCPVCRSVHASNKGELALFFAKCDSEDQMAKTYTVYYDPTKDKYYNYKTNGLIHVSTAEKIFDTRQSAVDWIKAGNIFSTPTLTYSESVSFILKKKSTGMFLDQFNGLTTSYEGARAFLSAKKARGHLRTIEDFDPKEWMAVRCETQFLMVSKE